MYLNQHVNGDATRSQASPAVVRWVMRRDEKPLAEAIGTATGRTMRGDAELPR